jgi:hypothetical protein
MWRRVSLNQSSSRWAFLLLEIRMRLELNKGGFVVKNPSNAKCLYELSADQLLFVYIKLFVAPVCRFPV